MIIYNYRCKEICAFYKTKQVNKARKDFVCVPIGYAGDSFNTLETNIEYPENCKADKKVWNKFMRDIEKYLLKTGRYRNAVDFCLQYKKDNSKYQVQTFNNFEDVEKIDHNGNEFIFSTLRDRGGSSITSNCAINGLYYCFASTRANNNNTCYFMNNTTIKEIDKNMKYGDIDKKESWNRINKYVMNKCCFGFTRKQIPLKKIENTISQQNELIDSIFH